MLPTNTKNKFIKGDLVQFTDYDGLCSGLYVIDFCFESKSGMFKLFRLKDGRLKVIANEIELQKV